MADHLFAGSENSISERQLIDKCAALYGSVSGLVEQIFVKNLVINMSERETVSHTPDSIRRADAFKIRGRRSVSEHCRYIHQQSDRVLMTYNHRSQ